jgi:rhodanese-related sulfurtransferase
MELLDADRHGLVACLRLSPIRAEQPVPPRDIEPEIAVRLARQNRMVDAVHVGRDDEPAQHAVESHRQADVAVVEHRVGVEQHLEDQHGRRAELMDRLQAGLVTVLDVRPEDEFALGHLPGAINVPLGELERRLADRDPRHEIIAYCRGAYCVLSYEAVAQLRARGFNVRRLEDGYPEWRAAGLPVEAVSRAD